MDFNMCYIYFQRESLDNFDLLSHSVERDETLLKDSIALLS